MGDPFPELVNVTKQCFCEAIKEPKVFSCGKEGEDCTCKGNIFYGALESEDKKEKPLPFEKMLQTNFNVLSSDGFEKVVCGNEKFDDPLPGKPK